MSKVESLQDAIIGHARKAHGAESVRLLDDERLFSRVKAWVPTPCFALDAVLHTPGLPAGRIITIVGSEGSGKTTLATHILAQTQKQDGVAVLLDSEYAFDKEWARKIGIDPKAFIVFQPESIQQAVKMIADMITDVRKAREETGKTRLLTIVWDSVASTPTAEELADEFGNVRVGGQARALSGTMRYLAKKIAEECILLLVVNQEKERIDFYGLRSGGKTMVAEHPLGFHSSVILRCTRTGDIKDSNKHILGIRSRITVKKNKLTGARGDAEMVITDEAGGIDQDASILAVALQAGVITKDRGWCLYEGKKFRESAFSTILDEHEKEIMAGLQEWLKPGEAVDAVVETEESEEKE